LAEALGLDPSFFVTGNVQPWKTSRKKSGKASKKASNASSKLVAPPALPGSTDVAAKLLFSNYPKYDAGNRQGVQVIDRKALLEG
jgi:hypothetical protein